MGLEIKILDKENNKEELNKTEKKPKKLRESIYKINDNPKRDRNFSDLNDLYDKDNDIEEKGEDEYSFNSELNNESISEIKSQRTYKIFNENNIKFRNIIKLNNNNINLNYQNIYN